MGWYRAGPVLGGTRRRRGSLLSLQMISMVAICGVGVWLWIDVIGGDIDRGTHVNAVHADEAAKAVPALPAAVARPAAAPGGPAAPVPPDRRSEAAGLDPVVHALLATARDHLARKVVATAQLIEDPRASKGSHLDLIDRGLGDFLPLRTALARHRFREPHLYGLAGRPPATTDERRRALTGENLAVFLDTFATRLPVKPGQRDGFEPGDVLLLQRRQRGSRLLAAIVTDSVDDAQNPQVVTLDPAEGVAREHAPFDKYLVRHHFRLHSDQLGRVRAALDLGREVAQAPGTAL